MEENKTKIFLKPIDGEEFEELKYIGEAESFSFEPLEEPIDVKYDPTPFTISFDIDYTKCNIRKLFYTRIPRKKKKKAKKLLARLMGDIYCHIKHLRYNYYKGTFYWIK